MSYVFFFHKKHVKVAHLFCLTYAVLMNISTKYFFMEKLETVNSLWQTTKTRFLSAKERFLLRQWKKCLQTCTKCTDTDNHGQSIIWAFGLCSYIL